MQLRMSLRVECWIKNSVFAMDLTHTLPEQHRSHCFVVVCHAFLVTTEEKQSHRQADGHDQTAVIPMLYPVKMFGILR